MTTNDYIGIALLTLLFIGIAIGYYLFLKSVIIQDKMESGDYPSARKMTRGHKEQMKQDILDGKLHHSNN